MIRINLLPFRSARRQENVRRQISIFCLSFVLVGIGLYYYHTVMSRKVEVLNSRIETVKKELKKKRAAAKEVDEIKKALALLKIKMDGLKTVKARRREPAQLLESMTRVVIQKRMWFTQFTANNTAVGIHGIALDQKTVADFMTRLENTGLFSNVNLATLRHVAMKGVGFKSFQVTCERASSKPATEEEKR